MGKRGGIGGGWGERRGRRERRKSEINKVN
jgi:hypothetical protein